VKGYKSKKVEELKSVRDEWIVQRKTKKEKAYTEVAESTEVTEKKNPRGED